MLLYSFFLKNILFVKSKIFSKKHLHPLAYFLCSALVFFPFLSFSSEPENYSCRICQSNATSLFWEKLIRGKYMGEYYLCNKCGSLQVKDPIWLNETYSEKITFTDYDPGRFERIKLVSSVITGMKKNLKLKRKLNILDFGSGEGILKKISKDNVTNYDPYFDYSSLEEVKKNKYDLIVCIEVLEHLEKVHEFLSLLKELKSPDTIILCTTELIDPNNLDPAWPYFIFPIGTHITFWSEKSFDCMKEYLNYKNVSHFRVKFLSFHLLSNHI